jgi:hypothetical protein
MGTVKNNSGKRSNEHGRKSAISALDENPLFCITASDRGWHIRASGMDGDNDIEYGDRRKCLNFEIKN